MRTLDKPSLGISAEALFKLCAESFNDEGVRNRLLSYSDTVARHSVENENLVPSHIHEFLKKVVPEQVPKEDMIKVYNQKLVGGLAREYYDSIKFRAPLGKCPICGVNTVATLDHYLPKTQIPTLSVDPSNLVPACDWCNHHKSDVLSDDPSNMPVHLYFDTIPDGLWLHTDLGEHLEASYYTQCPNTWDSGIKGRVTHHLDYYHLYEVYSSHAAEILANLEATWKTELEELSDEDCHLSSDELKILLYRIIKKARKTAERQDLNSCTSAFYRGLELNMDTVYSYFGLQESVDTLP